jgi:hypothetical protein
MSFLKNIFGAPQKPRTMMDELNSVVVTAYRRLAKLRGTAPTDKTTDQKIIEIYTKVLTAFKAESKLKGEFISADILNLIAYKFFQAYEMTGEDFMNEHLDYEIELYRNSGLREDYKEGLDLFNSDDNKRISVIQDFVKKNYK